MNVDNIRTENCIIGLTQTLAKYRIDIARIQETHNGRINIGKKKDRRQYLDEIKQGRKSLRINRKWHKWQD